MVWSRSSVLPAAVCQSNVNDGLTQGQACTSQHKAEDKVVSSSADVCLSPCCLLRRLCTSDVLAGKGMVWCGPARFATPSAAFGRRMLATSTTHEQPYYPHKRHSTRTRLSWYKADNGNFQYARHSCMCGLGLTWWQTSADAATVYSRSVCHVAGTLQANTSTTFIAGKP